MSIKIHIETYIYGNDEEVYLTVKCPSCGSTDVYTRTIKKCVKCDKALNKLNIVLRNSFVRERYHTTGLYLCPSH